MQYAFDVAKLCLASGNLLLKLTLFAETEKKCFLSLTFSVAFWPAVEVFAASFQQKVTLSLRGVGLFQARRNLSGANLHSFFMLVNFLRCFTSL